MCEELVKRLHRYSENCVAYKLDADFASAVQEAADAIEKLQVVMCRDCENWDTDWVPNCTAMENEHFCPMVGKVTGADWFCADGEKRKEGDKR